MRTLRQGLLVQGRVINALMLREIHTINGKSRLGYLWVLIQTMFNIAVFWGIRMIAGAQAPHGMSMLLFLASGFCVWNIFSNSVNKCMSAVDANRALLTFPQVKESDVMLARVLVLAATEVLTLLILTIMGWLLAIPFEPDSLLLLIFVLLITPLLGLGLGMIFSSLAVFVPVLEKLVPMALRVLFFASGVFFSVTAFSHELASWLLFNPVMQLIEMLRMSLHTGYLTQGMSYEYVIFLTIVALVLGGFLERYTRDKRDNG